MKKNLILSALIMAGVVSSHAAILGQISDLVNTVGSIIGVGIGGLMFSLVTVTFFGAVINFIIKRASGDANGMQQAKNMLGWTTIGMFVMFSIWGIIYFLQLNILGGAAQTNINKPQTSWTTGSGSSDNSNTYIPPSGSGNTNQTNSSIFSGPSNDSSGENLVVCYDYTLDSCATCGGSDDAHCEVSPSNCTTIKFKCK